MQQIAACNIAKTMENCQLPWARLTIFVTLRTILMITRILLGKILENSSIFPPDLRISFSRLISMIFHHNFLISSRFAVHFLQAPHKRLKQRPRRMHSRQSHASRSRTVVRIRKSSSTSTRAARKKSRRNSTSSIQSPSITRTSIGRIRRKSLSMASAAAVTFRRVRICARPTSPRATIISSSLTIAAPFANHASAKWNGDRALAACAWRS